jgi:hypothetical protein
MRQPCSRFSKKMAAPEGAAKFREETSKQRGKPRRGLTHKSDDHSGASKILRRTMLLRNVINGQFTIR